MLSIGNMMYIRFHLASFLSLTFVSNSNGNINIVIAQIIQIPTSFSIEFELYSGIKKSNKKIYRARKHS